MSKALCFFNKYVVIEIDAGQSFDDCVSDISDTEIRFNNADVNDSYKFLAVPIDSDDGFCLDPPLVSKDGKNWAVAFGSVKIDGEVFEHVGEVRAAHLNGILAWGFERNSRKSIAGGSDI